MSAPFPANELCINGSGGPTCLTRPYCALVKKNHVGTGAFARSAEHSEAAATTSSMESVAVLSTRLLLK